ncbi:MAG: radical SAM protein [Proteobacteria bacterium]|nr:radical SAM protein [Pseudomonadota bacterium]MBU1715630.1 radical SAM protein [Pseudomonadota bacterium]
MVKVFLGNAPWQKPGFYGVRAGSRWPHFEVETNRYMPFPFQLAYAAAFLEKENFEVLLVDAIAEELSDQQFIEKITNFAPDLVVLEVSTPSFSADLLIAQKISKDMSRPAKLVFCGAHAPMGQPEFLATHQYVDFVLLGEYEFTLLNMVKAIAGNKDLQQVPGLLYREQSGKVISTGKAEIIKDADAFPWPARHFLPMARYFDNPGNIPEPALQMWASRGCPYSCSYCIWPQLLDGNSYRPRQPAAILDEIEQVCFEYGYKSIYFDDDTFNIGKERMLAFCREKNRRGLDLPWAIMARADLMDREILEAMAGAGLKAVKYGVESADPDLIARVGKKLDLDKAIENIEITKSLGIKIHLTFMFGIPGETWESVEKTVSLAKKLNPDSVQFSILTPLPGTRIYDELTKCGHLKVTDWEKLDGYFTSVVRTESMSAADLEEAAKYAWRSWAKHKAKSMTAADLLTVIKMLPRYCFNPVAAWNQAKRLIS